MKQWENQINQVTRVVAIQRAESQMCSASQWNTYIQKTEPLPQAANAENLWSSAHVNANSMQSSDLVKVKVNFCENIFVIQVPQDTDYNKLAEVISRNIYLSGSLRDDGPLRMRYIDKYGNIVSLGTTECSDGLGIYGTWRTSVIPRQLDGLSSLLSFTSNFCIAHTVYWHCFSHHFGFLPFMTTTFVF